VKQMKTTSQTLEMSGPRGQIWRPAQGDIFTFALSLVAAGRTYEGLMAAQDAYVSAKGDMHGVDFRVVTKEVTVTFLGAFTPDMWEVQGAPTNNSNH
jgi:hypothetical protein